MDILDLFNREYPVITDGSMGTYLSVSGYSGPVPECANIEAPGLVYSIHSEYIRAGASVIIANTFGANKIRMTRRKMSGRLESLNNAGVEIALRARGIHPGVRVAGDMGPTGELLEPYGSLPGAEAGRVFAQQASILAKAGVDFILLETFQDLEEMKIAYNAAREACSIPVVPSFALSPGRENRTIMGQKAEDLAAWAGDKGIMGINCGLKSGEMKKAAGRILAFLTVPLWVKPNAGIPGIVSGVMEYPEGEDEFAGNCAEMASLGASFIGGCCGTTPSYIRRIKRAVKDEKN